MTKTLPGDVTSYDLLKALAVVLMIVDHAGFFFFPEEVWFRVLGRICVPIWFFLIGYANTRETPFMVWGGGVILVLASFVTGPYVFPVTILFTLMIARLLIDRVMARALRGYQAFAGMFLLLFLLSLHTAAVAEYGTMGLILAMYGYIRRHKDEISLPVWGQGAFALVACGAFAGHQLLFMEALSVAQLWSMLGGLFVVVLLLFFFRPQSYPAFKKYAGVLVPVLHVLGRRTLMIYVLHLLFFRALSLYLQPERFRLFDFEWMQPSLWMFINP